MFPIGQSRTIAPEDVDEGRPAFQARLKWQFHPVEGGRAIRNSMPKAAGSQPLLRDGVWRLGQLLISRMHQQVSQELDRRSGRFREVGPVPGRGLDALSVCCSSISQLPKCRIDGMRLTTSLLSEVPD